MADTVFYIAWFAPLDEVVFHFKLVTSREVKGRVFFPEGNPWPFGR